MWILQLFHQLLKSSSGQILTSGQWSDPLLNVQVKSPQVIECCVGRCTSAKHVHRVAVVAGTVRVALSDGWPWLHWMLVPLQASINKWLAKVHLEFPSQTWDKGRRCYNLYSNFQSLSTSTISAYWLTAFEVIHTCSTIQCWRAMEMTTKALHYH